MNNSLKDETKPIFEEIGRILQAISTGDESCEPILLDGLYFWTQKLIVIAKTINPREV